MTDHVKPVLRDNADNIVFHISSNKTPETIAKPILDLAISSNTTKCDVIISNILIRKYKHQQKVKKWIVILKSSLRNLIFIILIMRRVSTTTLNKSRLHLNKRGISVLFSNFIH